MSRFQQSDSEYTLDDNSLTSLMELDEENLLIGTLSGVYRFEKKTEKFHRIVPEINSKVNGFEVDDRGHIWIGTNQGVFLMDRTDQSVAVDVFFLGIEIRALTRDDDGNIWMGTFQDGIKIYDPDRKSLSEVVVSDTESGTGNLMVLTVFKSDDGNIWVGTLTNGLGKWNKESGNFEFFKKSGKQNSISSDIVRVISQKKTGELLIGTEKGLNVLTIETGKFETFSNIKYDKFSLGDNSIWSLLVDNKNNVWVGTYFGGISYLNTSDGFFNYFYPSEDSTSIKGKAISSFLEIEDKIWVGTEDAGLFLFDPHTKEFSKYPFHDFQMPLSYYNIHSILRESENQYWIGTYTGGLDLIDLQKGSVKNFKNDPQNHNTLSNNGIYATYKDSNGVLWVGTIYGLNRFEKETNQFVRIEYPGLSRKFIHKITENQQGDLLVLTHGQSLFKKKKNSNEWESFILQSGPGKKRFITMLESKNGTLYLGTEGAGIFKFENGEFYRVFEDNRLLNNPVYSILEDNDDNIWASTNEGLFCIEAKTGQVHQLTNLRFIQSPQFNYNAGMVASNGQIYFGGVNGFNSFDPRKILDSYKQVEKNLFFHSIQLFNSEVKVGDSTGILTTGINYTDQITLTHDQSMISFEYGALDFDNPKSLKYAYFLEGFDQNWNIVASQTKATYTNLPPGKYTFHVRLEGPENELSKSVKSIDIVISPPFYKSNLAYLFYFVLITFSIFLLSRSYHTMVKRKNKEKNAQLRQREEKAFYKRKIQFFTEMAHEIRTPLSLIVAPLEKLLERDHGDKNTENHLNLIKKNSDDLMDLINQLLDFRKVESAKYQLKPEKTDIANFLKEIHSKFQGISGKQNISFSVTCKKAPLYVMIDIGAMSKIINNLIINAFKYARTEVKLNLELRDCIDTGGGVLMMSVWDDGIGIPYSEMDNVFEKFFTVSEGKFKYGNSGGTGIGLFLAKKLTEIHGGTLKLESVENHFTSFTVEFPLESIECRNDSESDPTDFSNVDEDKKTKILVVEDNAALLDFLSNSLIEIGYSVKKAISGRDAMVKLKEHHIDLVLSDVMMDEVDGLELCRYIKDSINYCQIPVILLTAKADPEMELDGLEVGADSYVVKPFKFKNLELVIRNLLDVREKMKLKFSHQPLSEINEITKNTKDETFVKDIIQYIEENVSSPTLSVVELSQNMGVSRSSLHKKLKTISGLGPNEFIKLIRLKAAARLLNSGVYNISEVCYMSGFTSPSYFSKCFQVQFNMTPSEFISESIGQNG
ncbi:response regulator [Algoriphagus sp. AGSA1]|uniref:hybrid sensor histidine kinase/response regulator transcription factor n=1 Tax=Algoriphagus sp. AGSA1 TaxID=2907213 RepID=UPI001F23AB29|nr:two-component regulator propeller domain-containing protein [Algoriphagus sp. AGSA1]MCE7054248.1 response regulator [Algoriphagus sp. AGSA1]